MSRFEASTCTSSKHLTLIRTSCSIPKQKDLLTAKQTSTQNITDQSRNDSFPDIQTNRDFISSDPDSQRDESHVGDDVIEPKRYEREDRPPDADDLGGEVTALDAEKAGEADEPVASDAAEEDHVEIGGDLLFRGECDYLRFEGIGGEDVAIYFCVSGVSPS